METALGLMSDDSDTRFHLVDLDYLADKRIQNRLTLWLEFLNDYHCQSLGSHAQMVASCIIASKRCELFRTQTKHEFEISTDFLRQLFYRKRFLTINDLESARFMLTTSLVLGKYPGMVVGAISKSLESLLENGLLTTFRSLFHQLFVKYEMPHYLVGCLPNLKLKEFEVLMHVLQGNNIRTFPELPLPISRKESWVLQNAFPENVQFEEDILLREIVCSKLLIGTKSGGEILQEFAENCKPFQFNLQIFIDDLAFWKQAFNMCCDVDWDEVVMSMGVFLDHLEYRRYVHEEDFTLKGRSPQSLEDELFDWNERQNYEEFKKLRHLKWQGHGLEDWVFEIDGEEYKFSEIKTGDELFEESQNLKHCAYSYIQYCADGNTSVWSLKRMEDSFYKPYITVEIRESEVWQARGLRNRNLEDAERELLKLALEKFGFDLDIELDEDDPNVF